MDKDRLWIGATLGIVLVWLPFAVLIGLDLYDLWRSQRKGD